LNISNPFEKKYKIFPVPTTEIINIKNLDNQLYFEIISITGKRIKTGYTNGAISVSQLNNGIYFIILDDGIHKNILKFVKC
jgi:hypothetical protein